jgi:hypothetical protein
MAAPISPKRRLSADYDSGEEYTHKIHKQVEEAYPNTKDVQVAPQEELERIVNEHLSAIHALRHDLGLHFARGRLETIPHFVTTRSEFFAEKCDPGKLKFMNLKLQVLYANVQARKEMSYYGYELGRWTAKYTGDYYNPNIPLTENDLIFDKNKRGDIITEEGRTFKIQECKAVLLKYTRIY